MNLLEDSTINKIFDKQEDVFKIYESVIKQWTTNSAIDIMSFIHNCSGELSTNLQHDPYNIIRVVSNKETFNFGVLLERNKKYKNITLINYNGTLINGIKSLNIRLDGRSTWIDMNQFKFITSPWAYMALFSKKYIQSKLLLDRLQKEAKYYHDTMKDMLKPDESKTYNTKRIPQGKTESEFDEVPALVITVNINKDYKHEFNKPTQNTIQTFQKRDKILFELIPTLQTYVRLAEFSHWKTPESVPPWITNDWKVDKKEGSVINICEGIRLKRKEYVVKRKRLKVEI
jgi:hypothetical protein